VYGQEAVLPWKIMVDSRRVEFQNNLTTEEYAALMNDNIEDLTELMLWSLERIKENKAKVAHAYNKKVKLKEFQVRDLIWEVVLPLGNAYMLEELHDVKFPVAVNGQHLKKYFPCMSDDRH
jgi:hypothetical protein